jgi:hypothetical protein
MACRERKTANCKGRPKCIAIGEGYSEVGKAERELDFKARQGAGRTGVRALDSALAPKHALASHIGA